MPEKNDTVTLTNVAAVLALGEVLLRLIASGAITIGRLREIAATEGATPEELAQMDQRLSAAIARREAEIRSDS